LELGVLNTDPSLGRRAGSARSTPAQLLLVRAAETWKRRRRHVRDAISDPVRAVVKRGAGELLITHSRAR